MRSTVNLKGSRNSTKNTRNLKRSREFRFRYLVFLVELRDLFIMYCPGLFTKRELHSPLYYEEFLFFYKFFLKINNKNLGLSPQGDSNSRPPDYEPSELTNCSIRERKKGKKKKNLYLVPCEVL